MPNMSSRVRLRFVANLGVVLLGAVLFVASGCIAPVAAQTVAPSSAPIPAAPIQPQTVAPPAASAAPRVATPVVLVCSAAAITFPTDVTIHYDSGTVDSTSENYKGVNATITADQVSWQIQGIDHILGRSNGILKVGIPPSYAEYSCQISTRKF